MAQELLLTYAPSGIKAGSSGFCTVGLTDGTPAPVVDALESLSGYELPLTPQGDPLTVDPLPALHAHYLPTTGGLTKHFLTCIRPVEMAALGKRTGKFARHLILDPSEELAPGPSWLLKHAPVFDQPWDGQVRVNPSPIELATGVNPPRYCRAWEAATGDAGWAGVAIEQFLLDAGKPIYIVYSPGTAPLELVDEALSLMSREDRWRVTFSTYFTKPLEGVQCCWRFVLDGTGAAHKARSFKPMGYTVLDLTKSLDGMPKGKYADLARNSARDIEPAAKGNDGWTDVAVKDQTDYDALAAQIPKAEKPPEARFKGGYIFWALAVIWPVVAGVLVYNQTNHLKKAELLEARNRIETLETKMQTLDQELAKWRADAESLAQQLTAAQAANSVGTGSGGGASQAPSSNGGDK
jgi:hypothetical protein